MFSKKLLFVLLFVSAQLLQANMNTEGFVQYKNYYFVETGTHKGDGVKMALQAGFSEIHSVELDSTMAKNNQSLFSKLNNVHIYCGDSGIILGDIIKNINKPITFWLDGHSDSPHYNSKNTPLLEELDHIKNHPIKTHTIIIDDMRCCGTIYFDYITKDQVIEKILEINPNYTITFINGAAGIKQIGDILVAKILK